MSWRPGPSALGRLGRAPSTAVWDETEVSPPRRYQLIADTMRELARREPTFALHVHVGVADAGRPDPAAQRAAPTCPCCWRCRPTHRSGRAATPAWPARARCCSGRSRARGLPRAFASYEDWVDTSRCWCAAGRSPRRPSCGGTCARSRGFGTVEVRIMDTQIEVARHRGACRARAGARPPGARGGLGLPGAGGAASCWPRTASWPRATAWTPSCWTQTAPAACP